jgi:hypothetical protein
MIHQHVTNRKTCTDEHLEKNVAKRHQYIATKVDDSIHEQKWWMQLHLDRL